MKKVLYVILAVVVVVVAASVGGGFYMLSYSLSPDANRHDQDSMYMLLYEKYPDMREWTDSMKRCGALRDTFVMMPTGERHYALYARNDSAAGRTAVLVHGYKDSAVKFLYLGRMYHRDLGYNILLPDLHAHGLSEGDAIQMGWKDRNDVIHWIEVAEQLFRTTDGESRIVVHGVSMGAATTMNVSGEQLAPYVRCFVEDCGYTSVYDEFDMQLKDQFSLPSFPLMPVTSALCQLKYGWNFEEASSLRQVAKCHLPMLFIHGGSDTFVPTSMVYPLYDTKPEPKRLWVAEGSEHAKSFKDHPSEYLSQVKQFVGQYLE